MNTSEQPEKQQTAEKSEPRPNEQGGFYFSSFFKITDPETGEVLVQARGD